MFSSQTTSNSANMNKGHSPKWQANRDYFQPPQPEAYPVISDLDLMKIASAIPPTIVRDVATKYLGLPAGQANGSPMDVLRRWRASTFGATKEVSVE